MADGEEERGEPAFGRADQIAHARVGGAQFAQDFLGTLTCGGRCSKGQVASVRGPAVPERLMRCTVVGLVTVTTLAVAEALLIEVTLAVPGVELESQFPAALKSPLVPTQFC